MYVNSVGPEVGDVVQGATGLGDVVEVVPDGMGGHVCVCLNFDRFQEQSEDHQLERRADLHAKGDRNPGDEIFLVAAASTIPYRFGSRHGAATASYFRFWSLWAS
jgi:hypothetical protein